MTKRISQLDETIAISNIPSKIIFPISNTASGVTYSLALSTLNNYTSLRPNLAFTHANSAFSFANTTSNVAATAFIQANAAFIQANTPSYVANSAAIYANGAFGQANAAFIQANTPSYVANSASIFANGAFIQANAAFVVANSSSSSSISAFIQANAAFVKANSLVSAANTNTFTVKQIITDTASATGGGATVGLASTLTISAAFGSSDYQDPASSQAVRGRVTGANLTATRNYITGVTGSYNITGTSPSLFPKAGVLGVIGDQTTTADSAVMAYLDGDGGLTTANSAFGVAMVNTTPASGFKYGLDLKFKDTDIASSNTAYTQADIRLYNGLTIKSLTTAVTNLDSTSLPAGTMVVTSHATGVGKMFISDGSQLKQLAFV